MDNKSLAFFSGNGFYSFSSKDDEYLAFCHCKKIKTESYNIFQLIDILYNTEKFWVKDNEYYYSLEALLNAYPLLKQAAEN
jgi:hypothetical protein